MQRNNSITQKKYWDQFHIGHKSYSPINFSSYKNYIEFNILRMVINNFKGSELLEIGAGSSDWLIEISKKLPNISATGLDYSMKGCESLKIKSAAAAVSLKIVNADMFSPPKRMIKSYDFILSFGVVEHFKDLPLTLNVICKYAKPNGIIFTLIPNMKGINGWLTKFWNKKIYDLHVPHDLKSFTKGHHEANLKIIWSGYFGSNNFGVMSSCFKGTKGFNYWCYKQLTRISKIIFMFEKFINPLPATKIFSPYIIVISRLSK
jgi:ubiquinone/menaquinone biosynthesis C-methylase UbiE